VHDRDAGVLGLVLSEELVGVAEVVERGDGEGDVTALGTGVGGRAAAGGDQGDSGAPAMAALAVVRRERITVHSFVCVGGG